MRVVIAGTGQPFISRIIDSCLDSGFQLAGYLDDNVDNFRRDLEGKPILGGFSWIQSNSDHYVVNSIARTCQLRRDSTKRLELYGARFCNAIHSSVDLTGVSIGVGNIIGKNVILEPGVVIGNHNVILSSTIIAHNTVVGDFNFLGLGVIVQGNCTIGSSNFLCARSTVEPSISISDYCVVSAGGVVHRSLRSSELLLRAVDRVMALPRFSQHFFKCDA